MMPLVRETLDRRTQAPFSDCMHLGGPLGSRRGDASRVAAQTRMRARHVDEQRR